MEPLVRINSNQDFLPPPSSIFIHAPLYTPRSSKMSWFLVLYQPHSTGCCGILSSLFPSIKATDLKSSAPSCSMVLTTWSSSALSIWICDCWMTTNRLPSNQVWSKIFCSGKFVKAGRTLYKQGHMSTCQGGFPDPKKLNHPWADVGTQAFWWNWQHPGDTSRRPLLWHAESAWGATCWAQKQWPERKSLGKYSMLATASCWQIHRLSIKTMGEIYRLRSKPHFDILRPKGKWQVVMHVICINTPLFG